MPRVCASNGAPYDFCVTCFPSEEGAAAEFNGEFNTGASAPDERGSGFAHNAEHPAYGEGVASGYRRDDCGAKLPEADN